MPRPEFAGLPEGGPATLAGVKLQLKIPAEDTTEDEALNPVIASVNSTVRGWPCCADAAGDDDWTGAPAVVGGATMLAARLYRRRNSPAGVELFTDQGAAYVMRSDPDIGMLLKLGSWSLPGIG